MNGSVININGFAQNASKKLKVPIFTHIAVIPHPGHLQHVICLNKHGMYISVILSQIKYTTPKIKKGVIRPIR